MEAKLAKQDLQIQATTREIKGLRAQSPTIATLPTERLEKLFTTKGLKLGRLTGGWDKDRNTAGDEGIKIYIVPIDEAGQPIKMSGTFTIEAFDLADKTTPLVGTWDFNVAATKEAWRGAFMDYTYVLECPWKQATPKHEELTLKVKFLDELTQTSYEAQQVIRVHPAGTP